MELAFKVGRSSRQPRIPIRIPHPDHKSVSLKTGFNAFKSDMYVMYVIPKNTMPFFHQAQPCVKLNKYQKSELQEDAMISVEYESGVMNPEMK